MNANKIAKMIFREFKQFLKQFNHQNQKAKEAFVVQRWKELEVCNDTRNRLHEECVKHSVEYLRQKLSPALEHDLWLITKSRYRFLIKELDTAELAETYYNSVFCRLFDYKYYHNQYIFFHSQSPTVRQCKDIITYKFDISAMITGLYKVLTQSLSSLLFEDLFEDLDNLLERIVTEQWIHDIEDTPFIEFYSELFIRGKGAYLVGRIISAQYSQPFTLAILHNTQGKLVVDALITQSSVMRVIFGFARAYFMVNTSTPVSLVSFLNKLMPNKSKPELFCSLGYYKHGKTLFYRELQSILKNSIYKFNKAPGTPGLVMEVFTMADMPFVFKVIKDHFPESKPITKEVVKSRYLMVKMHNRVGRMADTMEFSNVQLPKSAFNGDYIKQLLNTCSNNVYIDNGNIIIKHVYIERKMTPLNLALETCSEIHAQHLIKEYGQALKDMMSVNIFPGDMLLKNFGVSDHNRVIFYDFDEVQYLDSMNFRMLPKEVNHLTHYSIAPNDVFPEQICTFVMSTPKLKQLFRSTHPELLSAKFWQAAQKNHSEHCVRHVFPYPSSLRFNLANMHFKDHCEY